MYDWIGKITLQPSLTLKISKLTHWLPDSLLQLLLRGIGFLAYCLTGKELRGRIQYNMQEILTISSKSKINKVCRQYFCNLVFTLYEILIGSQRLNNQDEAKFQIKDEYYLQEALRLGKGAIIYSPHVGNFFYYYWYLSHKYPCMTVGTAASPELRPLYEKFEQMGCQGLDYDRTAPIEMMRKLRQHLAGNGVVFILGDFWRPQFPLTELFGRVTRGPEGAAALALDQQVPVVPFFGYRKRGFNHVLTFAKPIQLEDMFKRKERHEAAQWLNQTMESTILDLPEHWFYWFNLHERWEVDSSN